MRELIELSRRYGGNSEFVIAGGGNTSWKNADDLFVKASGAALESIDEGGFVRMDRARLSAIWTAAYPEGSEEQEKAVLADMMAARRPGEEGKRPSVETLLHDALPRAFVLHGHPALVNGLTCSARGEAAARELFGEDLLWIASANPGYILSRIVKDAYEAHSERRGKAPAFILLQNHGIFIAADRVAEADAIFSRVVAAVSAKIRRKADFSPRSLDPIAAEDAAAAAALLARLGGTEAGAASVLHVLDAEIERLVSSRGSFAAVASPFTPDHIVYAGSDFLWAESASSLEEEYASYVSALKRQPKLAAVKGLGVFGIGALGNEKSARLAAALFRDAAKIAAYAEAFGGPRYMSADQVDFINNWEVERYRSKISTAK